MRESFDKTVWSIVWQIPPGKVVTYGQIAAMIPPPEGMDPASYLAISPRWVGYAMRRCASDPANYPGDPSQPSIPWQRVINSQGMISLPEGSPEAAQQRIRLEDEGVEFDKRDRVDLRRYRWPGPDEDWLRERGLLNSAVQQRDD